MSAKTCAVCCARNRSELTTTIVRCEAGALRYSSASTARTVATGASGSSSGWVARLLTFAQ